MFGLDLHPKYQLAADAADTESERDGLVHDGFIKNAFPTWKASTRAIQASFIAVLFLLTVGFSTQLGFWLARHLDMGNICTRHTSKFSPILDDIDITYQEVQFDGRFVRANVYRGEPPSREVDDAWEALGVGYRQIILPDELAYKAGLTKNHTRRNSKYGGGYPVFVEGLHQLHCLNLIRKSLYYNYDYYHVRNKFAFSDPADVLHWHVSHCVDFIRQRLMCTMDIGVFGSVWVGRDDPRPFVDFNTKHVCRNFEQIRQWAESHQVAAELPADFLELPLDNVHVWDAAP